MRLIVKKNFSHFYVIQSKVNIAPIRTKMGRKILLSFIKITFCQFRYTAVVFVEQVEVNHQSDIDCPEKKKTSLGCEKRARER